MRGFRVRATQQVGQSSVILDRRTNNEIQLIALLSLLLATLALLLNANRFDPSGDKAGDSIQAQAIVPGEIYDRIDTLEAENRTLSQKLRALEIEQGLPTARGANEVAGDSFVNELKKLKQQIQEFEQTVRPVRDSLSLAEEAKRQLDQRVGDTNRPLRLRIQDLEKLRALPFGMDVPSQDTLQSLVKLWSSEESARNRRDVIRAMMGITDKGLIDPLIAALKSDDEEDVREEAVDYLAFFLDDPRARTALERALKNDPNPKVRRHAKDALAVVK